MNKSFDKYFVIGFNKTATTTFHNIFLQNNLTSQHTVFWETNKYTCFSDCGNINDFKKLDLMYKNAIFILNVRELDKWLISRFKHGLRYPEKPNWAYPYTRETCIEWIHQRKMYHLEVLNYFKKRPQKLIIVNIEREGWINYLCSQLNFKNNIIKSVNIHKTDNHNKYHKEICQLVRKTLEELHCDGNIVLLPDKGLLKRYLTIYNNYI